MNYGKKSLRRRKNELNAKGEKRLKRGSLFITHLVLLAVVGAMIIGSFAAYGVLQGIIDSAPAIGDIDVSPKGYSSFVYDAKGNQTAKLVSTDSNRIPVSEDDVPQMVRNAFVVIEDERFYSHNGIDIYGIIRAAVKDVASGFKTREGASTITQQLIKNNVFDGWTSETTLESVKRKIQEQYLAIHLEEDLREKGQDAKTVILINYLNTINLGHNTLGVQAASNRYFDKSVKDLTLAEASVLAAIPQNPTEFDPITNPDRNNERRQTVLTKLLEQDLITKDEYDGAAGMEVYDEIREVNIGKTKEENQIQSYFVDALTNQILDDLMEKGYSRTKALGELYSGGLKIYSTQDPAIQAIADEEASDPANYPSSTSYFLNYVLTVVHPDNTTDNYDSNSLYYFMKEQGGNDKLLYRADSAEAAEEAAMGDVQWFRNSKMGEGDNYTEKIVMTPQPQISITIEDQHTGYVLAMVGGRGTKSGNRTLNRATDTTRQPGSTFKIVSTYAPAIDLYGYTLASAKEDKAYHFGVNGSGIQVYNYSRTYSNSYMAFREAIIQSTNTVAVKTISSLNSDHREDVINGPINAYNYLQTLGFTTLIGPEGEEINGEIYTDCNQTMALGGLTYGVKNIELNAAYAAIANGGVYKEPKLYTKVVDYEGNVILDNTDEATDENRAQETRTVMKKSTAWLLTSAMHDVMTAGNGTGRAANFGSTYIAGKTGTTSDNNDVWFCGYTTKLTGTVWAGYDNNIDLNSTETNLAKTMWRAIMERIPANQEWTEFEKPDNMVTATVCKVTGQLPYKGVCPSITEYFVEGTEPAEKEYCEYHYEKYKEEQKKKEEARKKAQAAARKKAQKEAEEKAKKDREEEAAQKAAEEAAKKANGN